MSRHLIVLRSIADRERVAKYAKHAPYGSRVEFKAEKRSLPQNDRFWAMLTDISRQHEHCGKKYAPDTWKQIFLSAWKREMQFIPALDGNGLVPIYRSSDLSKGEMSELIDFIAAWATENGIELHDSPLLEKHVAM